MSYVLRVCPPPPRHTHIRVWLALPVMFIMLCCFTLTSCSSDPQDGAVVTNPTNNISNPNLKSGHRTIADWTDAGELHNSILRLADDSLSIGWPNRYANAEGYNAWLFTEVISNYSINIVGLTAEEDSIAQTEVAELDWEEDLILSSTEFESLMSDLVSNAEISQREADFISRLRDIEAIITSYTDLDIIQDSLDSWKSDILGINWDQSEQTIVSFMSTAYYSFDFWRNEGLDDTDPNYDGDAVIKNDGPLFPPAWVIDYAAKLRYMTEPHNYPEDLAEVLAARVSALYIAGWVDGEL